jgi:hypothetical protein
VDAGRQPGGRRGAPGGILGDEAITLAATASLLGFDSRLFLEGEDPVELLVAQAVVEKAAELREQRDENMAVRIANAVGKLFKKGS